MPSLSAKNVPSEGGIRSYEFKNCVRAGVKIKIKLLNKVQYENACFCDRRKNHL